MCDPVSSRIFCQRGVLGTPIVVAIARMEKKSKAGLRKDRVRESGKNVKLEEVSAQGCEMTRCQELLDGQVRKLHDQRAPLVDDGDQSRTRGQHSCLLVDWPPFRVELRNASLRIIEVKCQNFGQLLNTERPDSNGEAVKETARVFSVLLVDVLQYAFVGLVQGPW